jgi:hypothetical protein
MSIKNGMKPLSQKQAPASPYRDDELFGNVQTIPEDIQKELDAKGLVGRWLDNSRIAANGGYHPKGWVPYRREGGAADQQSFMFGQSPDGYVRRGTLILGAKTKEAHAKHTALLKQQADYRKIKSVERGHAEGLRRIGGSSGLRVHEGYEEDNNNQ